MTADNKQKKVDLKLVSIKPDDQTHIQIRNQEICRDNCKEKACTVYCPTQVFSWEEKKGQIEVDYNRCIECLACPHGCPYDNIAWQFPQGGYGVDYHRNN